MRSLRTMSLAFLVALLACSKPSGPTPIVWNEEVCAECRMHVGDPRFAVQLETLDGDVFNFDDPGCFFAYVRRTQAQVRHVWFRDSRRDAWIGHADVGFVATERTPMGYGLGAVERGTPGAFDYAEAGRRVRARLAREDHHGSAP